MRSSLYATQQAEKRDPNNDTEKRAHFDEELVRENEVLLSALGNTVARMKNSAGALLEEAEEQNHLLGVMSTTLSHATSGVNRSLHRIEGVLQRYGCRHTLLIAATVLFAFLFIYHVLMR